MKPAPQKMHRWTHAAILVVILCALAPGALATDSLSALEFKVLGQKFSDEPDLQRIVRLEKVMKFAVPKDASVQYRLDRLYATQGVQVSAQSRQAAIRAYNLGIDAMSQGHIDKAIEAYQEALRLNPGMIEAYNNLGNLLEGVHKYHDAIQVYKKALLQASKEPLLYRNIGVLYEKTGNVAEAIVHYRSYIKLSSQPDPAIVNIVQNHDEQRARSAILPDYVSVAQSGSDGESLLWPESLTPIPIYIRLDPDQTAFLPAVRECLDQWERASNDRLRFQETGNRSDARITIDLREGPLAHPNMEVGYASYDVKVDPLRRKTDLKVSIMINTGERNIPISLEERQKQVKRLALHEMGHALGIWGHSPSPEDIMYSHPIATSLSRRDINTIQRLYASERAFKN